MIDYLKEFQSGMAAILQDELFCAACYGQLARSLPAQSGIFQRLQKANQENAATLRGICMLQDSTAPACPDYPPAMLPTMVLLRKCCSREFRCFQGYDYHRSNREFGCVFEALATRKAAHLQKLLTLIGTLF